MTDPDTVLGRIDTILGSCICGRPLPENGPSLDYCSDVCQYGYTAQQAGAEPDDEFSFHIDHGPTDGRTINEDVNAWIERTTNHHPANRTATVSVRIDVSAVTESARQLQEALTQLGTAASQSVDPTPYLTAVHLGDYDAPPTPEIFRARALEHRQNRGTGPAPRRQRRPRDHGPRRPR